MQIRKIEPIDDLSREVWVFCLLIHHGHLRYVLDEYQFQTRRTKRSKWVAGYKNIWTRQGRLNREHGMKEPPKPSDDVLGEVESYIMHDLMFVEKFD